MSANPYNEVLPSRLGKTAVDAGAWYLRVDLQVELPHAWDDGLLALRVKVHPEGGVLTGETVDALGELIRVILHTKTNQGDGIKTKLQYFTVLWTLHVVWDKETMTNIV